MARYQITLDIEYDSATAPETVEFMVLAALDVAESPLRVMESTAKAVTARNDAEKNG